MTRIQHGDIYIEFTYNSNLDGRNLESYYNVIEINDASDIVFENIRMEFGWIQFEEVKFPTLFETTGIEHTFSICGQWHWMMDKWIKEMSNENLY